MAKLLLYVALGGCSAAITTLLYKYFNREQNEVIFFYGHQKSCDSHYNTLATSNAFQNSDCSSCKVLKIVEWLNKTEKTLDICMYVLNNQILTNAIINAHKRGVLVRIIVDEDNVQSTWKLGEFGISKRAKPMQTSDNLMHHKFVVIDNKKIVLGSLNWTTAGTRCNWENIFITNQYEFIEPFRLEFQRLWKQFSE